jgi:hypothetical protein
VLLSSLQFQLNIHLACWLGDFKSYLKTWPFTPQSRSTNCQAFSRAGNPILLPLSMRGIGYNLSVDLDHFKRHFWFCAPITALVVFWVQNVLYPDFQYYIGLVWLRSLSSQRSVIGWVTKIYYLELLRASEGTLNRWFWLHLQLLAPTPVLRRIDVRQAAGRKNNCRIFITTWLKTCCTDPT